MGMRENWKLFIETTKAKAAGHDKHSECWNTIHQILSLVLITFSTVTTVIAAVGVSKLILVTLSGVTTLLSGITGTEFVANALSIPIWLFLDSRVLSNANISFFNYYSTFRILHITFGCLKYFIITRVPSACRKNKSKLNQQENSVH